MVGKAPLGGRWVGYLRSQDLRQVSGFHVSAKPGLGLARTITVTRTAS